MKKKKIAFLLLALIPGWCFSQNAYPKKVVIDGDTLVAITAKQMNLLNTTFIELDECLELRENLVIQLNLEQQINSAKDSVMHEQKIQLNSCDTISIYKERISEQKIKSVKKERNLFVGISIGLGVLLVLALF